MRFGQSEAAFGAIAEATRQRQKQVVEECRTLDALRDTLLPRLISGELRVKQASRLMEKAT